MAKKVTGQVLGGQEQTFDNLETIQDVFNELGLNGAYAATANGEPVEMHDELNDYEFISFAPSVKGGIL